MKVSMFLLAIFFGGLTTFAVAKEASLRAVEGARELNNADANAPLDDADADELLDDADAAAPVDDADADALLDDPDADAPVIDADEPVDNGAATSDCPDSCNEDFEPLFPVTVGAQPPRGGGNRGMLFEVVAKADDVVITNFKIASYCGDGYEYNLLRLNNHGSLTLENGVLGRVWSSGTGGRMGPSFTQEHWTPVLDGTSATCEHNVATTPTFHVRIPAGQTQAFYLHLGSRSDRLISMASRSDSSTNAMEEDSNIKLENFKQLWRDPFTSGTSWSTIHTSVEAVYLAGDDVCPTECPDEKAEAAAAAAAAAAEAAAAEAAAAEAAEAAAAAALAALCAGPCSPVGAQPPPGAGNRGMLFEIAAKEEDVEITNLRLSSYCDDRYEYHLLKLNNPGSLMENNVFGTRIWSSGTGGRGMGSQFTPEHWTPVLDGTSATCERYTWSDGSQRTRAITPTFSVTIPAGQRQAFYFHHGGRRSIGIASTRDSTNNPMEEDSNIKIEEFKQMWGNPFDSGADWGNILTSVEAIYRTESDEVCPTECGMPH